MKFKIRSGRGFCNEGKIYTAPAVARKLNGYKVQTGDADDPVWFLCSDDIEILEISEQEKNLSIEW